jgi:hypothetical protein
MELDEDKQQLISKERKERNRVNVAYPSAGTSAHIDAGTDAWRLSIH